MHNINVIHNANEESFSLQWLPNAQGWEIDKINLKIMNLTHFHPKSIQQLSKHQICYQTSDIKNFSQITRSDIKTSEVATLSVTKIHCWWISVFYRAPEKIEKRSFHLVNVAYVVSLLGQPKVNKVKIFLPFPKFMKCPQTKFHAYTMTESQVIRSKKVKIYR